MEINFLKMKFLQANYQRLLKKNKLKSHHKYDGFGFGRGEILYKIH